jgi:MFS family permease
VTATQPTPAVAAPGYRASVQRRTLRVLVGAQVLGGAGLAAGVSVGALLAKDLLGSTSGAGLPAALFTVGSAGAAAGIGRLSQRHGRRIGLTVGYAAGAVGGAGVVSAAVTSSIPLLLVSLTIYGAGTAANLQCRYAGADLADDAHRGRAVSTVLVATTVGAVAGPNLIELTGSLAAGAGLPRLSGPFVLASLAYAAAATVLGTLLRPDPLLTARRLAHLDRTPEASDDGITIAAAATTPPATAGRVIGRRSLVLAAAGMILAQAVMVAVMSMTPVHLQDHHHGLRVVGIVISLHIAFMYLPSPVTGRLVDRYTPRPVLGAGGATLVGAALLAAAAGANPAVLAAALALLGLGWNLSLIAGTAAVTALTTLDDRARTQGIVDLGVALAGAGGGLASGAVVAGAGFEVLALAAAALSLLALPAAATGHRAGWAR